MYRDLPFSEHVSQGLPDADPDGVRSSDARGRRLRLALLQLLSLAEICIETYLLVSTSLKDCLTLILTGSGPPTPAAAALAWLFSSSRLSLAEICIETYLLVSTSLKDCLTLILTGSGPPTPAAAALAWLFSSY